VLSQLFRDEFLEIWFQSIVARKLTAQHSLTSALLNVERVSPLLETLPFDRNASSGCINIEEDELEVKRLDALAGEFVFELPSPSGCSFRSPSISFVPSSRQASRAEGYHGSIE